MSQSINSDNNDHLHIIRHFAHQTDSTPVHLDNESIKGLRNLHSLVHNEDVGHDFSGLKTLFAQPNIINHLKTQLEKKKANGGLINDYINTLKQHGSAENSELTLVPNELAKFLGDSYSLGTTHPETGHQEYHLGDMFNGLNNIFKPVKDSMATVQQPRENHALGGVTGLMGYGEGSDTPSWADSSYKSPSWTVGYSNSNNIPSWATPPSPVPNVAINPTSTVTTGTGSPAMTNNPSPQSPGFIQRGMRAVAGGIGGAVGGLGAQYAGQRIGNNIGAGIPLVGPFVGPVVGNVVGNAAYNYGANRGRERGVAMADNFYNRLSGGGGAPPSPSRFSGFKNNMYNMGSNFRNAMTGFGTKIYNNLSTMPRFGRRSDPGYTALSGFAKKPNDNNNPFLSNSSYKNPSYNDGEIFYDSN